MQRELHKDFLCPHLTLVSSNEWSCFTYLLSSLCLSPGDLPPPTLGHASSPQGLSEAAGPAAETLALC